eukprot:363221-Chlamydomonas_euryale.AAC.26
MCVDAAAWNRHAGDAAPPLLPHLSTPRFLHLSCRSELARCALIAYVADVTLLRRAGDMSDKENPMVAADGDAEDAELFEGGTEAEAHEHTGNGAQARWDGTRVA